MWNMKLEHSNNCFWFILYSDIISIEYKISVQIYKKVTYLDLYFINLQGKINLILKNNLSLHYSILNRVLSGFTTKTSVIINCAEF